MSSVGQNANRGFGRLKEYGEISTWLSGSYGKDLLTKSPRHRNRGLASSLVAGAGFEPPDLQTAFTMLLSYLVINSCLNASTILLTFFLCSSLPIVCE